MPILGNRRVKRSTGSFASIEKAPKKAHASWSWGYYVAEELAAASEGDFFSGKLPKKILKAGPQLKRYARSASSLTQTHDGKKNPAGPFDGKEKARGRSLLLRRNNR